MVAAVADIAKLGGAWSLPQSRLVQPHCFLYVASRGGAKKVGITVNPISRLAGLKNGASSPVRFDVIWCSGEKMVRSVERSVHLQLRPYRIQGEWFSCGIRPVLRAVNSAFGAVSSNDIDRDEYRDCDSLRMAVSAMLGDRDVDAVLGLYDDNHVMRWHGPLDLSE